MGAGAPINNKNAEQWNYEDAKDLYLKAIELSKGDDYDFIGEIARDLETYRGIFDYLSEKFTDLKHYHKVLLSNLEANCFQHAKKGSIKEATAIVNLKSNYRWTDRADFSSNGEHINQPDKQLTKDELKAKLAEL